MAWPGSWVAPGARSRGCCCCGGGGGSRHGASRSMLYIQGRAWRGRARLASKARQARLASKEGIKLWPGSTAPCASRKDVGKCVDEDDGMRRDASRYLDVRQGLCRRPAWRHASCSRHLLTLVGYMARSGARAVCAALTTCLVLAPRQAITRCPGARRGALAAFK